MRIGRSLLLLACLSLPSIASAQAGGAPTRENLEHMLSGFEDTPTLAQIASLGEGAVPLLIAIHDDPNVLQPIRLRAVEAMGAFSTPEAHTFLLRVIRDPAEPAIVVREAVEALGQSRGAQAVPELTRLLSSRTRAVREAAIEALGTVHDRASTRALRAHAARERDTALRARITQLLAH